MKIVDVYRRRVDYATADGSGASSATMESNWCGIQRPLSMFGSVQKGWCRREGCSAESELRRAEQLLEATGVTSLSGLPSDDSSTARLVTICL